jgi:hypothetical protein
MQVAFQKYVIPKLGAFSSRVRDLARITSNPSRELITADELHARSLAPLVEMRVFGMTLDWGVLREFSRGDGPRWK